MGATRRKFTLEFRVEAARRVIDTRGRWRRWRRSSRFLPTRSIDGSEMNAGDPRLHSPRASILSAHRNARNSFGTAARRPSRRRTLRSWEKPQRTSQRTIHAREVLADGGGVRELRDRTDGETPRRLPSRLLPLPRHQGHALPNRRRPTGPSSDMSFVTSFLFTMRPISSLWVAWTRLLP